MPHLTVTALITYLQSLVQFVYVYQVLLSEYFFQKNSGCVNLITLFSTFHVYNFTCNLPNFANLYYLQTSDECLKICEESFSHYNAVPNKSCLKCFKKCLFCRCFFLKPQTLKYWIFIELKIWTKICSFQEIQMYHRHKLQVTATQSDKFFQHIYFFLP